MAAANMWGAPRIHGELLKLGIQISEATVSKYMPRRRKPPSQTWRSFLENHVSDLVSVDFFTVPTVVFNIMFVFVVLAHDRRRILAHQRDEQSLRGLDREPDRASVSVGDRAALPAAGS